MKVLIVGGGFGGLKIARELSNKRGVEITLIDKFNYHQFQPLFYQVATAGLDASNISFPLRKVFQTSKNIRYRLAEMLQVCPSRNKIRTNIGEFEYDQLIIATGANTNFFGNNEIEEHAFPMKSTVEALQLRHRLIQNFEDALIAKSSAELQRLLTLVVVGGGPTGVEISGALAEMRKYVLPKDYPELDFTGMKIYLIEGGEKTLGTMSEKSSIQSSAYLNNLGVTVLTNTLVEDYDGTRVKLSNGDSIESRTVIWAAGIRGNVPEGIEKELVVHGNRVKTDRYNRIEGYSNIFAIGDVAYMQTPMYPDGHPQVANVAIGQADNLAKNFLKQLKGNSALREYEYSDKGSMATVGRHLAVVDIPKPKLHFGGWIAWFIWMSLHLYLLVGLKNRLQVFINWIYKYVTYDQNLRLIFREFYRK